MRLLDDRLKAFLQVSQNGTVLGAAESLKLTQTAITQRIRSLENELGITLFTRSRKGMRLTAEGQGLLQYCKGAEELEGAVFSKLSGDATRAETHLTIVGPTSPMTVRVSKAIMSVMRKYPNLYLHLLIDDHANRVDLLRTDRAQTALVPPEQVPLEMDSRKVQADRFLLVCTPEWRSRSLPDILANEKIIDFYDSDFMTLNYLSKFNLQKHVRKPRLFVNNNVPLIELFIAGLGFGTLVQEIAQPYLESKKLFALNNGQALLRPLAMIWYPRPRMPGYFRETLGAIK
jgi:LysR family transcriptional regulator, chromosome initiation inhibitor